MKTKRKLWFSEQAMLLCHRHGNGFNVINGGWEGRMKGDYLHVVERPGHKVKITDWKEYLREEFDKNFPDFGY